MTAATAFEIRCGTRADANAIADVEIASWRAGYAHVVPRSVLDADDFDSTRRASWRAWRFAPGHRIAVALTAGPHEPGRVIGFASYGPERERALGPTGRGELWALYLHPDHWGSGVADRLLTDVEERLRAEGFATIVLWVLEDNPRARRFYERHGWAASGVAADHDEYCAVRVPEVEYRKGLR